MPFFNWCVTLLPRWMAPNLVTMLGLLCITISTIVYLISDLTMQKEFSSGTYVFTGIAIFGFMTLDILDGKQARRTGSSSPLGQMFDHGCDSWSCQMLIFTPLQILKVGNSSIFVSFYLSMIALFYSA